jgi:predicted Rossmann fold flavoprotein
MNEPVDVAVVGAGAAGLMAAIWAGRTARESGASPRILAFDGARKLGAKILISGGGRCNVTHDTVDESAFAGSSPAAIRKVLRRFDVPRTVEFFGQLGVELKREETGKLFPASDDARTILRALLAAAEGVSVELRHPARIETVQPVVDPPGASARGFRLSGPSGDVLARRVILATGGRSYPKTGSDGQGFEIAKSLGHAVTPLVSPALVPLVLDASCFIRKLSGLSVRATLEMRSGSGRRLIAFTDSTLCTHFGLSGPAVLDISRHYLHARAGDTESRLLINWLPGETLDSVERQLVQAAASPGRETVLAWLGGRVPRRLAAALCEHVGIGGTAIVQAVTRSRRRALAAALAAMPLPVTGDRGWAHAEVTAGGVPLRELHLDTMESRVCPGLYLCGEICDVDGRIGGYNFQWAWSSGYVAGTAAVSSPPVEAGPEQTDAI